MTTPARDCPVLSFRLVDGDTVGVTLDTTSTLQKILGVTVSWTGRVRFVKTDAPEIHDKRQAAAAQVVVGLVAGWLAEHHEGLRCTVAGLDNYAGRVDGDLVNSAGETLTAYLLRLGAVRIYDASKARPPWSDEDLARIAALANEPK